MMTRITLLAAPVLFTAATAVGDSVILRHSVRITDTGNTIHLADIATLEGEYATSLGDIEIAAFKPDSTAPLELRVSDIRNAMEAHDVHWGQIELSGHRVVVRSRHGGHSEPPMAMYSSTIESHPVTRTGTRHAMDRSMADDLLDTPTFRGWLSRSITDTLGIEPADLRLDFPRAHAALLDTPLTGERFEIKPLNVADHSERLDYEVRRWANDRPMNTELISVKPAIRTSVARLRADVQRGRPILGEHVERVEQWLTPLQRSGRVEPGAIGDRAAVARLRAGTILRDRDLKQPVLVKRGDAVRVSCLVGGSVVSMPVIAQSNGLLGETIKFRFGRERETFRARITARGEAVLDLSSPSTAAIVDASSGVHP